MGMIQSLLCSVVFCVERSLTWACCAFLLMMLMLMLVLMTVYGISVGYHYAQKELVSYAYQSRNYPASLVAQRSGQLRNGSYQLRSTNDTGIDEDTVEQEPQPMYGMYEISSELPSSLSFTTLIPMYPNNLRHNDEDGSPPDEGLSIPERELARKLIGRYRRSRNNTGIASYKNDGTTTTGIPFLRPLRSFLT